MTFAVILAIVVFSSFVLGYCIGGADRDDARDDALHALDELRRIHEQNQDRP
jgi:hypothetical protein